MTLFPPLWERDAGLLVIASLMAVALIGHWLTQPPRLRHARRPAILVGLGLALVLASKGIVASVLRRQGVAYPGDPEALWQMALVIAAAVLGWSLIALEQRRRAATDLVVSLGAEGSIGRAVELATAAGVPDESSVAEALSLAEEMAERNRLVREELSAQAVALEDQRRRLLMAEDDGARSARVTPARRASGPPRRSSRRASRAARPRLTRVKDRGPGGRLDRATTQLQAGLDELDELARGLDPSALARARACRCPGRRWPGAAPSRSRLPCSR